ncbi:hypothetical protein F2Q68_00011404 [Brassica cretica]|uniref:Uncharacterized protein n=1 Tax=Brassica cretica TaxID=69181 RepID=A0A8S9KUJ0_BRACR|nr:hypothetical protein F2Q68_00011404 [Brassica cretica]
MTIFRTQILAIASNLGYVVAPPLQTQMAAQQAGYEAQRRLNHQMMEMIQRMYPNKVFPDVSDP